MLLLGLIEVLAIKRCFYRIKTSFNQFFDIILYIYVP